MQIRVHNIEPPYEIGDAKSSPIYNCSVTLGPGLVALIGVSGSGKSSFISLISGELKPRSGTIEFAPEATDGRSFIYVDQSLSCFEDLNLIEQALLFSNGSVNLLAFRDYLATLEIAHKTEFKMGALSRGERQRALCAMALATPCDWVFVDEPLAHQDPINARRIIGLFQNQGSKSKSKSKSILVGLLPQQEIYLDGSWQVITL